MRKFLLALLALPLIASCGGDSVSSADLAAVSGVYALRTMNSAPLPFTLVNTAAEFLEVKADTVTLKSDGSFADVTYYNRTLGSTTDAPVVTLGGAWTLKNGALTFNGNDGFRYEATLSGNTFTISGDGIVSLYSK